MTTIDDIHAYYREEMAREVAEKVAEKVAEVSEKKLAEGMEKGMAEGKAQTAKNLLAAGIDIAVISSCTGLSEEQIKAL